VTELPSGTVTFLFTDIEGSTRLLKQLRERYGDVRDEHERVLRKAIGDAGGHEIDTQGDSFFVAFRRARDAVAAAVAAQRALAEHEWPEGAAVRVRMGIHTGEPAVGTDRYVGLGVHRAARICSAAHGGQVLLSETTRGLVEDELPPDVRVRDLGGHNLKDLDRPERLCQLVVEGLENEFPPPKTTPGETDALVRGRERELAEAARAAVWRFPQAAQRRPLATAVTFAAVLLALVALVVVLTRGGGQAAAARLEPNSVGLIDARGGVRRQVEVDKAPVGVAVGAGAIWVTNANDGTVSRVDGGKGSVVQTIPVGTNPNGIAVAGGTVWVANHDDGTVSRISPGTNAVVQPIRVGTGPTAVVSGLGSVWVTNATDRTLSRIDAATGRVIATITTNAVGRGVAVGASSVWVSDESSSRVVRIDPVANDVAGIVNVGNGPSGLAFGHGALWVANSLDGTVSRIDPTSASVTDTVTIGGGPGGIAVGKDAVWVSAEFGGRIIKIDPGPGTPRVVDSVRIDNRPKGVAVVDDGLWVAVQTSGRGHRGGRLVVFAPSLGSIDEQAFGQSNTDVIASGLVYDGLTTPRRTGGADGTQLVPDLARTIPTATDNGRTYSFRLRRNVRYSDGRLVRAADFARALQRGLVNAPDLYKTFKLLGPERCVVGRRCDVSRGVIVRGDTVTFRLSTPNSHLLLLLAAMPPIPPGTPLRSDPRNPPRGTGPYMVEHIVPKRELALVRNPRFHVWAPAARPDGYPDELVWRVGEGDKAVNGVLAGDADIALGGVPNDRIPELKARYARQLHLVPQNATTFLFLNNRQPPFDDIRVRRAVSFAIDRTQVVEFAGGADLAQPTCQTIPPTLPGYSRFCPYTIDPDASGAWKAPDLATAKRLIEASGTAGTRVVVWTFPYFKDETKYVVGLLRRLGYRAQLHYISNQDTYFELITANHPQAGLGGWFGTQLPEDIFGALACNSPINWADFCDATLDREIERLGRARVEEPSAAKELAMRIDRMIVNRAPWVPLFTPRLPDFVSKRVGNYQYNVYDLGVLLDQLWVR
jgi:peptide/nickel transport system substrate-binding protein